MSSKIFPSTGVKPPYDPNARYVPVEEKPLPKENKPPYDPKAKYVPVSETKESVQQQPQPQPAFKPMSDWLAIPTGGYQPIAPGNETIDAHSVRTNQAAERISKELSNIDPHIKNLIYNTKKDVEGRIKSEQLGINPKEAAPLNYQAAQLGIKEQPQIDVKPEEIEEYKAGMNSNVGMLRVALDQQVKDLSKTDPTRANQIKSDIYQLDAQDRSSNADKISKNIEKLKSGDLDYDSKRGVLIKPEGFFKSLATGFKQKNQLFKDYEFYTKTDNEAAIISELNARLKEEDPDEAQVVPDGALGEAGAILGGTPIKPVVGGIGAGAFTTPLGGATAAAGISAHEMYKLGYAAALPNNYAEIKKAHPGMPDYEAYQQAKALTEKQSLVDAGIGAVSGFIGIKGGLTPGASLLQKSVSGALRQLGKEGVEKGLEGIAAGLTGATGEVVKNLMAQKAGIQVETTKGVENQFKMNMVGTMGMAIAGKFSHLLKPSLYNKLFHGLSKESPDVITQGLNNLQETGVLTPDEVQKVQTEIDNNRKLDASIKPEVPESDRIKVQELIKKRDELESRLETEDKAYNADTKEEIKDINKRINDISKGTERGELQSLIDKEIKDGNVDVSATEILRNSSENDLKVIMKEIAQEAHNPQFEKRVIEAFGENIVNNAKELYPKEIQPESKISVIQPGEIKHPETITIKPKEDALPIKTTDEVDVLQQTGNGERMGEGDTQSEIPPGTRTQEESTGTSKERQVGEPEMIGITHAEMDKVSRELGLPEYTKDPETFEGWTKEAKDRMAKDPEALNKVINKLRNGEMPDPVETQMMKMHYAALKSKYNANPTPELLAELNRTKDLYNISGRSEAKSLVARKGLMPVEDSLADFHMTDVEFNKGAPLTEQQTAQSTKEYNEIKAAKDALDERVAKLEADNARLKAEKKIQQEAKSAKKEAKKDYGEERKQILKDIGDKWKKASKESLGASILPFAKEFAAIAPDVMKLVKNVVSEGIEKLPDIIKAVHDQIKEHIPSITEKNIHDIIAGEYTKKQTRSELQAQLYDLRKEAKLMNELDQLLNGEVPNDERRLRRRNQRIEELKGQIKALKDEMGLNERTPEEKLASLKGRYKNKIKEIEDKIAKGDYGPDEKPEPIKLDKETQDLKDEYIKLKADRQRRLAEQEYQNRSLGKKIQDKATEVLNVPRTVMASVDLSAPLRQGLVLTTSHPSIGSKAFVESVRQAISPKRFDRWLVDLKESPFYKDVVEKSGLYVADPNNLHLSAKEEAFMTNLAEKIPVLGRLIKGSERAYVSYLNKLRVDVFKQYADVLIDQGKTIENSPEIYEGLAEFVNNATGRGNLGKLEPAAQVLNTAFFSPRLIASRVNMINPLWYGKLPKEVRKMAIKDMAKMIGIGATTIGLFSLMPGVEVEKDPRSTDFGKIKVGNTRYDTWGGFQQYIRLMSQLISGGEKKGGDVVPLGNERGQHTRGEKVFSFFRGKLAPVPSMAVDLLEGKTAVGEEVTLTGEAKDHLVPMIVNDVKEAWQEQGPMSLVYTGVPSLVGIGTTTYEKKQSNQSSGKPTKGSKPTKHTKATKN